MQSSSTAWKKHTGKQTKARSEQLDKPVGQRLNEVRTVNGNGKNIFERNAKPKTAPVAEQPTRPRTRGNVVESPQLTAAREAEQARLRSVQKEKEEQAAIPIYMPQTQEEITDICRSWMNRNHKTFYPSEWNVEMVNRAVFYLIKVGKGSWNYTTLDAALSYLTQHNHIEPTSRVRGSLPPVEFLPVEPQPEPTTQRVIHKTEVSTEEMAILQKAPFEQLQQASRLLMKK